jgi:hypothetical protein
MIQSKWNPHSCYACNDHQPGGRLTLTYMDDVGEALLSRTIYQHGVLPFQLRIKLAVWSLRREAKQIMKERGQCTPT